VLLWNDIVVILKKMQRSEQDKIRAYNQKNSGDASEDGVDEIDGQSQH